MMYPGELPQVKKIPNPLGFKIVLKIICFSKKKLLGKLPIFPNPPRPRQQTGPVLAPDPPAPPDAGPQVESSFYPTIFFTLQEKKERIKNMVYFKDRNVTLRFILK